MLDKVAIEKVAQAARMAVIIEWRRQGHELTGRAARELETRVRTTSRGVEIQGLVLDYMARVNQGVPASEIRVDRRYIQGLVRYARLRFKAGLNEAQEIAYRIASAHQREGMPTRGSQRFSATGKRTGFIEDGLEKEDEKIGQLIEAAVDETWNKIITTFFQSILAGR